MGHPIFISYKRIDKDRVFEIRDFIETRTGLSCWIDLIGIESDAFFKEVIIKAINDCRVMLFMYSKAHSQIHEYDADWTIKELNFATKKKKRIVFVNIDGSRLTDEFEFDYGTKQQVDALDQTRLEKLASDLKKWFELYKSNDVNYNKSRYKTANESKKLTHEDSEKKENLPAIPKVQTASTDDLYQKALGYYFGLAGISRDASLAFKYFSEAAEKGHRQAQEYLAKFYTLGIGGITKDNEKAQYWEALSKSPKHQGQECEGLPKSLVFEFKGKKVYFILSEDKKYYLGNLNANGKDLSWWENKWVQASGATAICAAAVAFSFVSVPILILLLCRSIGALFSDDSADIITKKKCETLSEQIGYKIDLPTELELKGVKDEAKKSCVVLRLNENPTLFLNNH